MRDGLASESIHPMQLQTGAGSDRLLLRVLWMGRCNRRCNRAQQTHCSEQPVRRSQQHWSCGSGTNLIVKQLQGCNSEARNEELPFECPTGKKRHFGKHTVACLKLTFAPFSQPGTVSEIDVLCPCQCQSFALIPRYTCAQPSCVLRIKINLLHPTLLPEERPGRLISSSDRTLR